MAQKTCSTVLGFIVDVVQTMKTVKETLAHKSFFHWKTANL